MTSLAAMLQLIGFRWESEGRRLLKESAASREALTENLANAHANSKTLLPVTQERRTHPDDTCPGERRHNHLRGVPK